MVNDSIENCWTWTWSPSLSRCGGRARTKTKIVQRCWLARIGAPIPSGRERVPRIGANVLQRHGQLVEGQIYLPLKQRANENKVSKGTTRRQLQLVSWSIDMLTRVCVSFRPKMHAGESWAGLKQR